MDAITAGICDRRNGVPNQVAQQQSYSANVRFGSKADIEVLSLNVRFTSNSGHWWSVSGCPLCAIADIGELLDQLVSTL
jgi:hypothetical protein